VTTLPFTEKKHLAGFLSFPFPFPGPVSLPHLTTLLGNNRPTITNPTFSDTMMVSQSLAGMTQVVDRVSRRGQWRDDVGNDCP
jgi:hypothetical protein